LDPSSEPFDETRLVDRTGPTGPNGPGAASPPSADSAHARFGSRRPVAPALDHALGPAQARPDGGFQRAGRRVYWSGVRITGTIRPDARNPV